MANEVHFYVAFRCLTAAIFLIDLCRSLPCFTTWFGTDLHPEGPRVQPWWQRTALALCWGSGCLLQLTDSATLVGAALVLAAHRQVYLRSRWRQLARGAGAAGVVPHLFSLYIVFFELALRADLSGRAFAVVRQVLACELALVFCCAGIYKTLAGYTRGHGVEYAMTNPAWSNFWRLFRRIPAQHRLWTLLNHAIVTTQFVAGVLFVFPATQRFAAAIAGLKFIFVGVVFRIAQLGLLIGTIAVLFGAVPAAWLAWAPAPPPLVWQAPQALLAALPLLGIAWVLLLLLIKIALYSNLLAKRPPPTWVMRLVSRLADAIPAPLWRVFTADLTNFYLRISIGRSQDRGSLRALVDERTVYGHRLSLGLAFSYRYLHVIESITLAALFNAAKYFRSDPTLFLQRLRAYAATIPRAKDQSVCFEYILLRKDEGAICPLPLAHFWVDPTNTQVTVAALRDDLRFDDSAPNSPVREMLGYGLFIRR